MLRSVFVYCNSLIFIHFLHKKLTIWWPKQLCLLVSCCIHRIFCQADLSWLVTSVMGEYPNYVMSCFMTFVMFSWYKPMTVLQINQSGLWWYVPTMSDSEPKPFRPVKHQKDMYRQVVQFLLCKNLKFGEKWAVMSSFIVGTSKLVLTAWWQYYQHD